MVNKTKSDFLVATPSITSGLARLWDWYGLYDTYNQSRTPSEADEKAIASDWRIVGQDIQEAMHEFEDGKEAA